MKLTKFFTLIFVTMMVSMPVNILLDAENVQARPVENTVQTAEIFIYGWVNESGTGTPIQSVTVYFGDMHGYDASNSSGTDVSGYYELNLNVTNFHEFLMHGIHDAYLLNQTTFWINEFGGSVKINIELDTAPPRSSRLNGYLFDAITGLPMAGENLTAASDDYINNTQTDVSGYYSMGFIPGDYTMGAGSTGYESTTLQFTLDDSYTLWRNITLEPLNCTLKGFIKGSGGPLDNAYAYVEEPWNVDPWDDDYWNYTDATGYYEMNLTRGTKNVGFRNDGYLSTSRPITVQAGINWLNVTLVDTPPETCTVMGFIREFNTGNPINNSNIRVGNMNNSWGTGNNSDPTGYYELDVIEGNLRIEADKWDGEGQYHRNGTELTAVAGMSIWQNITLVNNSAPQATIRGNITLDGTPVSGDIRIYNWNTNFGTGTDGSGYYEIDWTPGYYEIIAMVRTNNDDRSSIERLNIILLPGETIWYDFDLYVLDFDSIILGNVENQGGQIVEDVICYFSNGEDGISTFQTASVSDFQGVHEIRMPRNEMAYYMILHPDYEMQYGSLIPAQEWNWLNITLDFIGPKVTVRGYLQDQDMNPLTGHEMMSSLDNWMNWTNTNSTGYYEIDVPQGDVYIDSQLDNSGFYSPGRLFLNTRSGNDIWLNITLRPQPLTYQLRGRVNESDNSPVIGATVTARYGARDFITITDATGKYTLDVPEGSPRISVRMDGYGYEGDEYISISSWGSSLYWQNLTLDTQNAWIELPITDSVVDIDGDGKYDWLYIDVTVNVAIAGEYDIDGDLYSDYWLTSSDGGISGTMSANAGNSSYLDPGLRIVRLAFYGPQVSYVGDGGFVIEIDLYDRDAGWDNIDLQYYFTNPYNSSDFDLPDLKDVDPPHSFGPLDTDFDGLYNVLMFNSTVEILAPGTYTFISRLYNVPAADNWQDEEIDQSYLTETLDVGIHTMEFSFSGSNIYNSGSHLGIASTMMMNGTGDMDENTMVWASQCYVPYNYTQFQNYPIDSYVYGWVNDTGSTPIANISVEIFNKTSRFVNRTLTDENGYFELGGWDADWILVMNDGDDTSQKYQGNLTSITLTTGTPLEINQELYDEILDSNEQTIIFDPNNWNKTVVDMMMRILIDNETIRYEFDMYEFGNGDGFISESETDMLMGFIGSMVQMPANLADEMNVDGITYDLDPGSAIYDIGIVGDVASKEPVYIHQKANFTANTSILAGSPHELNINMTYDNINTGSVSDGNSTTICYVYPPIGWGRTGNNDTANIVFSGTDEIIIDPLMDPIPGDGNESEWTNVTISDSQTPTVGTISGNVTLDGRSNHMGVIVKVVNISSGLVEYSGETDIFGNYIIPGVPGGPVDGPYNVTVTKGGYIPSTSEDRAVIAGQTTWFNDMVLYSRPPKIFNIQYLATVNITNQISIYADVTDDGQVGDVTLWYNDVLGVDYAVPMVSLANIYKATIPAQAVTGTVDFYIMANDTVGNSARNPDPGTLTIIVVEDDIPIFSNLLITSDPTEYTDTTRIDITVTDMSTLTDVSLYNHFTSTNTTMNDAGGGDYWLQDTFLALGTYNFTIWTTDFYGNFNSINGSFIVRDSTLPAIDDMLVLPDIPEFGDDVNISANITDLAGITNAWLDVQYPNGTALSNNTMISGAADSYYLEFSCSVIGQYSFTIWARDGNTVSNSVSGSFWINDTIAPTITNLTVPATVEYGDAVNITADIDDLAGLDNVTIQIFDIDDIELINETMNIGSYWWDFTPVNIGSYNFTIWAIDGNNLTNSSSSSFWVIDTTSPTIISTNVQPITQEVFDIVSVRVIAEDIDFVDSAYLNLSAPGGTWLSNVSMNAMGISWVLNQTYDLLGDYSFTVWVFDQSGNSASSSGTISTEDTYSPEASAGIDRTVDVEENVTFNADQSTDNYDIENYTWEFTDNGVQTLYGETVTWVFDTPGTYTVTLTITDYAGLTDTDELVITVNDVVTTGTITGTVLDQNDDPVSDVTVYVEGSYPRIEAITDNTGSYTLEYVPHGEHTLVYVHDEYDRMTQNITVSAGETSNAPTLQLTRAGDDGNICGLGILLLLIIGSVVALMLYKRKKAAGIPNAVIDEIFFMSTNGLLIKHFTRRLKPDMDQDILSGMLVAVQDFIKDSFRGEEGGLDELKFGKFQIVLGRGKQTIIAALILGDDIKPFKPQIDKCIKDIEEEFGDLLEEWDGDVETLTGSFKHVNSLIEGKYA